MMAELIQTQTRVFIVQRGDCLMGAAASLEEAQALAALYGPVTWAPQPAPTGRSAAFDALLTATWRGVSGEEFEFTVTAVPLGGFTPGTLGEHQGVMTVFL